MEETAFSRTAGAAAGFRRENEDKNTRAKSQACDVYTYQLGRFGGSPMARDISSR
jgi:hypothetical protein